MTSQRRDGVGQMELKGVSGGRQHDMTWRGDKRSTKTNHLSEAGRLAGLGNS